MLSQQIPGILDNLPKTPKLPLKPQLLRIAIMTIQFLKQHQIFRYYIDPHPKL